LKAPTIRAWLQSCSSLVERKPNNFIQADAASRRGLIQALVGKSEACRPF
jgi:hypothetical protein